MIECEQYDIFLDTVQTPEVISLQNSFDTTRTEKVLIPLNDEISTYDDLE